MDNTQNNKEISASEEKRAPPEDEVVDYKIHEDK